MGYSSWGCRVGHDWVINSFIFTFQGKKIEEQGSYNTCQDITNNFPSFKENKVVDHYEGKLKDFLIFISQLKLLLVLSKPDEIKFTWEIDL